MEETIRFPKILVSQNGQRFDAVAGLELKSILKGDLLAYRDERDLHINRLDPEKQQGAREAFLHAISSWPLRLSLELHLTALPDLIHRAQGRLMISLFLCAFASSEEKAKEEIVYRYLSLMPLLAAHLPEAEFIPITDEKGLRWRKAPFNPTEAVAIHRRQETLCLSTPLKRLSVGFGPVVEKTDEDNNSVRHLFPWVPSLDDWSRLMGTLVGQIDPIQIVVRLRPGAPDQGATDRLAQTIHDCELFLSGINEYQLTLNQQASLIRDMSLRQLAGLKERCFSLGVFVLAPHSIDTSLANVLGKAITGSQSTADEGNPFQGGFASTRIRVQDALKGGYSPEGEPVTLSEAACAFRLPAPPLDDQPGLPIKRSRTSLAVLPPGARRENGAIELLMNEHQGMVQPVTVGTDARMSHAFMLGQTGTGKSTLMESMILQDMRAGRGLAVIDPHGDMIDSILGRIPGERVEDVILFDTLDREKPLGFNVIQWRTIDERDLIIDELYLTIDRVYDMKSAGGPIFETNFRGMLKLLMGDKPREEFIPTLLEFASCYLNRDFRQWLKKTVKDAQALDFVEELERTRGEASLQNPSPYVTSKFSRLTHDTTLKRIVGQERTSFDFDEIINEGNILLVKLGRGRFGATVSAMLANQIVTRFKLSAIKRGDLRSEKRRDFFLYVDECHNLPSENVMELLSEARKFRMGLILATQYTAQLSEPTAKKNDLLSAILGNVGTTLIFRLGQEDAVRLSPVLYPHFTSLDILGLPNWQGYARLQINEEATPPFSFRTQKDKTPYDEAVAARIRNLSRLAYGRDAKVIDDQIARRRSLWKEDESGN